MPPAYGSPGIQPRKLRRDGKVENARVRRRYQRKRRIRCANGYYTIPGFSPTAGIAEERSESLRLYDKETHDVRRWTTANRRRHESDRHHHSKNTNQRSPHSGHDRRDRPQSALSDARSIGGEMSQPGKMNRRAFLRGAGTLLALPLFESLGTCETVFETPTTRFCFLYVPNGMSMENWRPSNLGPLSPVRLPPTL